MPSRSKKSFFPFNTHVAVLGAILLIVSFVTGMRVATDEPSLLFVQEAVTGSFRPIDVAANTYTLTLVGVKPHTLLFTDRPQRMVGSWTMNDFISRWNEGSNSLANNPPNAVLLSHSGADGKEYAVVIELSNPVFNAPGGTLTYKATVLKDGFTDGLVPSPERHMDAFPLILRNAVLFIDNAGVWGVDSDSSPAAGSTEDLFGEG